MPTYSTASGAGAGLVLPIPLPAEPPDGPKAFTELAKRLEDTVGYDTGWADFSVFSTFSGTHLYRKIGQLVTVHINLTCTASYTGSPVTMNLGTYPTTGLPSIAHPSSTIGGIGIINDGPGIFRFSIGANGDIDMIAYAPSGTGVGSRFTFNCSYPVVI